MLPSHRKTGNGQKWMRSKFHPNTRENFFTVRVTEHWNREGVQSPSRGIFQNRQDTILYHVLS